MEGMEMEGEIPYLLGEEDSVTGAGEDLAVGVLARFQNSDREDHQHLCAAVGAMAQALRDQGIPSTPVAYFSATASSLDRLSREHAAGTDPVTAALLSFLSSVLPGVPLAVVRCKGAAVGETLVRILGFRSLPVGGVKAGLRCAAYLLLVGDKSSWSRISPLYGVILGFSTDHRPKVRKQSHSCLRDVLHSFQRLAVLVSASEGITATFERFLLLAGGSSSSDSAVTEGPKGAIEVLYLLNALKDWLPLMSMKCTNVILKYLKTLLDLHQSIVTRSVMEILHALCSSQTSEVAYEVLLDLLCSLALSVAEKEKSGDAMASTARLLLMGTKKAYELNKQTCVVKLPIIVNALGDILASEHEEAIYGATEALKGLICSCIGESLIKQGVDEIKTSDGGIRKSGPTIIEKICVTIEGFLGYRYNTVWDMSFQVLSTAFDQLGKSSKYLMAGAIRSLGDMQNLADDDFPYRKQLHECIGSAVRALGPKKFLGLLPLNLDAEDISDANVWLLPVLKQYLIGARLSYFTQDILDMVRCVQQKSHKLEKEGRIVAARSAEGLVYSLWSLLPAFCNYPCDTSSSFKVLQKVLCYTLRQEPDLRGIICSSLQILIRQNNNILSGVVVTVDDEMSMPEKTAKGRYTKEFAEENLKAIQSYSSAFLSVLSKIFMTSLKDSGGWLQSTIHEFASISDRKVVRKFFMKTQELLEVSRKAIKAKQPNTSNSMQVDHLSSEASLSHARAILLDLAVSFLPGLGEAEIDFLLKAIKPAFQDEEGLMQKKAYKILSIILKEHGQCLLKDMDELLELMIAALPSCHFSAKRHRLESLYFLIVYNSKDSSEQRKRDIISSFLTEIILALKEANKKTRNRAYDLLVEIGHAYGDEEKGGKKENLQQFFYMIAGGLAGGTPHMISAAVKGLARLAYEFSDLIGVAYNLLPSTFLLLQRKNREIIKANLGLMKVLVAKSKADGLEMHLRSMVEGLLKWQDDTKNRFKAKVKLLLEMLVRKCGLDAVKAVMPEEHMKLLTNIRKTKEREERKAKAEEDGESLSSRTSISRQSRWNHTRIFSDFGDEEDDDDDSDVELGVTKTFSGRRTKASSLPGSKVSSLRSTRKRQAAKSLPEDLLHTQEDDPLDLLDRLKTRSALQSSAHLKRKQASYDEPEIDPNGRLVVREEDYRPKNGKSLSSDPESDTRSYMGNHSMVSSSSRSQKRWKTTESGWAYTGSEYTSKRASGDVKKKDKLEPYAYWPLDRKLLNRRTERKTVARKGMARVMKFTKKLQGKSASSVLSAKSSMIRKKHKGSKKSR